ncbi:unnamed protein product, partial [Prorocentrum cordatum]
MRGRQAVGKVIKVDRGAAAKKVSAIELLPSGPPPVGSEKMRRSQSRWDCALRRCTKNLDARIYCKRCLEWKTIEAPTKVETFIGITERMGKRPTADKCKLQIEELRRGPAFIVQERAQRGHDRIQQLEDMLGSEVDEVDQCQTWVAIQSACARKSESTSHEADAERAKIVSQLARTVAREEAPKQAGAPKVPPAEVVDGSRGVASLIDLESFQVGDMVELAREDVLQMGARKEQLRQQVQVATEGLFQDAMEK